MIAFASLRMGSRYVSPESDIVLLNPYSGSLHWLTDQGEGAVRNFPSWSPDGSQVMFTKNDLPYVVQVDDKQEQALASPFGGAIYHPSWSANNNVLAMYSPAGHYPQIWMTGGDSGEWQAITPDMSFQFDPVWSPDGTAYAFSGAPGAIYKEWIDIVFFGFNLGGFSSTFYDIAPRDIYIIDVTTEEMTRVTTTDADDFQPEWSPDGSRLAFVSLVDQLNSEIYVIDRDGGNLNRLTNNPAQDLFPSWSPDGQLIVYSSDRSESFDIFSVPANGGASSQMTDLIMDELHPVWSPAAVFPGEEVAAGYDLQRLSMKDVVDRLHHAGLISTSTGQTIQLQDYSRDWAQIGWFSWTRTGEQVTDFVLRANASWESASDRADWFNSGCGFVFREEDDANFYVARFSMDGITSILKFRFNQMSWVGRSMDRYPFETPADGANIMLAVEDNKFMLFLNGMLMLTQTDSSFDEGSLGLTLFSGTNAGFGTSCDMENVELFKLE